MYVTYKGNLLNLIHTSSWGRLGAAVSVRLVPTCLNLVLEGDAAVVNELLQGDRSVRQVQVQQAQHVGRMVEVQHLAVPVVALSHELHQHLCQLQQELSSDGHALLRVVRQHVCNMAVRAVSHSSVHG